MSSHVERFAKIRLLQINDIIPYCLPFANSLHKTNVLYNPVGFNAEPLLFGSFFVVMNKPAARPKPCRAVALDVRPCPAGAVSSRIGKPGRVKRVEMTDNDLKAFGHALLVGPAPAPNAALAALMHKVQA